MICTVLKKSFFASVFKSAKLANTGGDIHDLGGRGVLLVVGGGLLGDDLGVVGVDRRWRHHGGRRLETRSGHAQANGNLDLVHAGKDVVLEKAKGRSNLESRSFS